MLTKPARRFLDSLTNDQLECRDLGHALRHNKAGKTNTFYIDTTQAGQKCYARDITCQRCGTTRTTRYDAETLQVIGSSYQYDDSYLADGITISRAEVRMYILERDMSASSTSRR